MADMINFTLPQFSESTTDNDIKQIKSYLYTLTEQMKFYLNNIDSDNFNDEYNKKVAALIDSNKSNSIKANVLQESLHKFKKNYENAISEAVEKISGNLGGYIVTLDLNEDGFPDDLRILVDTSDYKTATKYWQFNREGLAYILKEGNMLKSNVALTADGFIAADRIKGILGEFVTLNACTLNACTGSFEGQITAGSGIIGNWQIIEDKLLSRIVIGQITYETVIKNDKDIFDNDKKTFYVNKFTDGYNSDMVVPPENKEELFYVRRNGFMYAKNAKIGDWTFEPEINGHGGFYSDYGNWRVYIQSAYASSNVPTNNQFAFTTQYKQSDGNYICTFWVTMDGNVLTDKNYYVTDNNHGLRRGDTEQSYGLVTYSGNGNVVLGDFNAGGDVNIYSPNRIFMCIGNYSNRIYIADADWTVGGNLVGKFHTFCSNRAVAIETNEGNSEFLLKTLRFRLLASNINTTGTLYYGSDGIVVTSSSAAKFKENITAEIDEDLNPMKLLDAVVKQFNYKKEYSDNVLLPGKQIGFIADELDKVYPLACLRNANGEAENWNERIIIPALFYIVKQMYTELTELKEMQKL